jgi:hypothetical protein
MRKKMNDEFLDEIIQRVEAAYDPDEVVGYLELSMRELARAFEPEFLEWAYNEGFFAEYDQEDVEHD